MSNSTLDHLIEMANQIGDFFETMSDREQSLKDIAAHLKRTWAPPMRRSLMEHVEKNGAGLNDIVRQAMRAHKLL